MLEYGNSNRPSADSAARQLRYRKLQTIHRLSKCILWKFFCVIALWTVPPRRRACKRSVKQKLTFPFQRYERAARELRYRNRSVTHAT